MVRLAHQAGGPELDKRVHGCLQAKEVIMNCASSSSPEIQFDVESLEGPRCFCIEPYLLSMHFCTILDVCRITVAMRILGRL